MNTLLEYYQCMVKAIQSGLTARMKLCPHCGQPMVGSVPAEPAPEPPTEGTWRDRPPLA